MRASQKTEVLIHCNYCFVLAVNQESLSVPSRFWRPITLLMQAILIWILQQCMSVCRQNVKRIRLKP